MSDDSLFPGQGRTLGGRAGPSNLVPSSVLSRPRPTEDAPTAAAAQKTGMVLSATGFLLCLPFVTNTRTTLPGYRHQAADVACATQMRFCSACRPE